MEELYAKIDDLLERSQIEQCAIAVVNRAGNILWQNAFGSCSLDTEFHLFSGTKIYTAVAVMKLVEEDKLALADPVSKYLPEMDDELAGITIEQLLGHASGLKDTPMQAFLSATLEGMDRPTSLQALQRFQLARESRDTPVLPAKYVNLNYVVLGEVIERITQQSYPDYVTENVLKPLGSSACFSYRDATKLTSGTMGFWNSILAWFLLDRDQYKAMFRDRPRIPTGQRGAGLYTLNDFDTDSSAIGGLIGTVQDFCPLLVEFLRHSSGDSEESTDTAAAQPSKCLSPSSLRQMTSKHFDGSVGLHSKEGVGLAWKWGTDFINHEGGGPGFTSETRCYLDEGMGIVILTNSWSANYMECTVCHEICEIVRAALKPKSSS